MKAIVCKKYGSPLNLQVEDVEKPTPKKSEVLIKVHASAINDYDWSMVRGKPYLYRLLFGLFKPKRRIPGMELSGVVEQVHETASKFKIGDAVYGDISEVSFGSFAEYICVNERALTLKPNQISFAEAASLSHASMLAYQGLHDIGKLKKNEKVLINGAGGGVGSFALQLAKIYDCEVTGVDTGDKLKGMKSLGFDCIIDYKKEDFTKNGQRYDLILDAKTTRSPFSYMRSLNESGRYVTVGGTLSRLIQLIFFKGWIKKFKGPSMQILALKPNKDLETIHEIHKNHPLKFVIDGPHPLPNFPQLLQYFGEGKHFGKIIISLNIN